MTTTDTTRTVRIFRTAKGIRLLEVSGRTYDLSAYLARSGHPEDLVELCARGFFDRDSLGPRLPRADDPDSDDWTPAEQPAELGTPVAPTTVGKILALGKNFGAHAAEFDEAVPEEPLFFNKLPETLVPHRTEVTVPSWYEARVDHEAELCVVIGRKGSAIPASEAMNHVAGYTIANDLTARSMQGWDRNKKYPWFRAKNMDGFCPLGPCVVPRDFLDISNLRITARVGNEVRQDASTADLIVDVPHAIEYLSRHLTLRPGDLVLMGTPAGVGPLEDGDVVVCSIEGIGELETTIRRP